jgi:hypothetical protein
VLAGSVASTARMSTITKPVVYRFESSDSRFSSKNSEIVCEGLQMRRKPLKLKYSSGKTGFSAVHKRSLLTAGS